MKNKAYACLDLTNLQRKALTKYELHGNDDAYFTEDFVRLRRCWVKTIAMGASPTNDTPG